MGTFREPRHPLLRSHLWTNFPLVSGLGVGECVGLGVGGKCRPWRCAGGHLPACSREWLWCPSSQHALGRQLWLSPSQHALYHKGLFFFLFCFLFYLFCVFFLLLLLTPHRTWMKSVSVVLHVCGLDAFLWNRFPVMGNCGQTQHSECVRATPREEGQATSTSPTPPHLPTPPIPTPTPYSSSSSSSNSLGSGVRLSRSEIWEASLGTGGVLRRI